MAKRVINAEVVARWEKEGRGTGTGIHYKPWLTHQDVPKTHGTHLRVPCLSNESIQKDLFSLIEVRAFKVADLSPLIKDIREQFRLPIKLTLQAADEAGIRHPLNFDDKSPYAMTTDLLLTLQDGADLAIDVKESTALANPRTLEKLEITRRTWKMIGTPWFLVTEKEVPETVYKTVNAVHAQALAAHKREAASPNEFQATGNLVFQSLRAMARDKLADACHQIDGDLHLASGTALMHALHMFHTGRLVPDWSKSYESQIVHTLIDRALKQQPLKAAS
jgi:hypothetical protein